MKRVLLISLSLVLALVGWSAVCAEDGFYVIPAMRGNYAPVPKTGQIVSVLPRDDGDLENGVPSPTPRFTDNNNGTVTDKLTRLIWMKNANAFGVKNWGGAIAIANDLEAGYGGLTDGSKPGDWRLPNVRELQSLVDYGREDPCLPEVHPFTNTSVQSGDLSNYWSSTAHVTTTTDAWGIRFGDGAVNHGLKSNGNYVWCVRGGP